MKPEIKAMLPELVNPFYSPIHDTHLYYASDVKAWLDKLTEDARDVYTDKLDGLWDEDISEVTNPTQTALLICPRERKKQTPLEIAVEALRDIATETGTPYADVANKALAKIEAAK